MIVPMMKYSLVLYHRDYEAFLAKLQELGLMDVTITGWEPTEQERRLMADIDNLRVMIPKLKELRREPGREPADPFETPRETLDRYVEAVAEIEYLQEEIARTQKEADKRRPWGEFSKTYLEQLAGAGVTLHFFTAFSREFEQWRREWEKNYVLEKIAEVGGTVYFVIATGPDNPHVEINANREEAPESTPQEYAANIENLRQMLRSERHILSRAAEGVEQLEEYGRLLRGRLHLSQVNTSAPRGAEGALVLMEGWVRAGEQQKVDDFLETDETAYSFKSEPAENDDAPVQLKNNRFAEPFEFIGEFYSLPKYGTLDMTPWFAPFYMVFFGFCLADAGFGALYLIAAVIARFKLPKKYQSLVTLVICLAVSTIFFGLLSGNAFGIQLIEEPLFAGLHRYMLDANQLFLLSVAVGVVHIFYALIIKIVFTIRSKGFVHSLSTVGWMIVILSLLAALGANTLNIDYKAGSLPFWIVTGSGLALMLFTNSPGKNLFLNFGNGLWETFNNAVGMLGDVLSYIRLFALGLSGGVLSLVFNKLALELSPDIVVVKQLVMILILGVGQGLTLFMSSLSAFVHSLRLTFVEFYKNAGFVEGGRPFNPLKKEE